MRKELKETKRLGGIGSVLRMVLLSGLFLGVGVVGAQMLLKKRPKPRVKRPVVAAKLLKPVALEGTRAESEKRKVSGRSVSGGILRGFGTTEALRRVDVVSEVSGAVTYVSTSFRKGARVSKGELLVRVDSRNYVYEVNRLKSQLTSLRKQIALLEKALKLEEKVLERNEKLVRRKMIDTVSFERMRIQLFERKQRLEQLRQNEGGTLNSLRKARLSLSKTKIRAPFAGRVKEGSLEKGAFVAQGRVLGKLESRDAVEIPVAFSLVDLQQVRDRRGRPVDLESLPKVLRRFPPVIVRQSGQKGSWMGRVVRVGSGVNLSTRTVSLYVRVNLAVRTSRKKKVKRSYLPTLLPGTFCQVEIPLRRGTRSVAHGKKTSWRSGVVRQRQPS